MGSVYQDVLLRDPGPAPDVWAADPDPALDVWDPDPALDVWDPDWDRGWEPPHDWAAELAADTAAELAADTAAELAADTAAELAADTAAESAADTAADTAAPLSPEADADDAPRWIPPAGWTGEGEVFAAGFLHRDRYDDVPDGAGFAAGGFADQLAAGPLLAALTGAATGPSGGYAALGESELIGVLCAWRRLASWAEAGQAGAITALSRRRHAQARERENRHLSEHVGDEIAAALTLTGQAAAGLHGDSLALARLPEVHASLASGLIDWPKACVFSRELRDIPAGAAGSIAAEVLPDAPSLTTAQIRGRLRRLVLAFDPDAASQRKAAASGDTDVVVWTESSGNAALAGRELPESDVLAVDRRLTALARWLANRGAEGSIGQLRSAAFLTLLRGVSIHSLLPPGTTPAGDSPGDPPAGQPAVTGTIHLTMPLSTWAGLAEAAGEVAGYGPVDAATGRDLAALMASAGCTRWQVSLVTPAGEALATAAVRAGQAPPPGPAAMRWAAGVQDRLTYLQTMDCRHDRAEHGYQPSRRLRNLVIFRQPECGFPGCRRPASRCDLDHTQPYDEGGRTCECNLAPLCRQHHRAKQAPGWRLTQDQPGVMRWQLPSGRRYRARAHCYPV